MISFSIHARIHRSMSQTCSQFNQRTFKNEPKYLTGFGKILTVRSEFGSNGKILNRGQVLMTEVGDTHHMIS